ncbi:MAG: hypothetical protein NVS4B2_12500 [Chloroflexota bacterium]
MLKKFSIGLLGTASVLLAACGGPTSSTGVGTSLGGRSLAAIDPPPLIPGPLNGLPTPRRLALRRPLAVIIENSAPASRPQSGLSQASTVIETLAEYGITRFMAIYLERDAPKVGPVRSTRMYFDNWAAGFHTILAHDGGNDDAQRLLWHLPKVFNIDELRWEVNFYNTGTTLFWRSRDRITEHNMYVNTLKLRNYAIRNRQDWVYTGASFPHKAPLPRTQRGRQTTVDIAFLNPLAPGPNGAYAVHYKYDRATNTYTRYMGGVPHVDQLNGKLIRPANVVVMTTAAATYDPFAGQNNPQGILIPSVGRGRAVVFQDGRAIYGSWLQVNRDAPLHFLDSRGHPVALNPGQTWIEVVPQGSPRSWVVR